MSSKQNQPDDQGAVAFIKHALNPKEPVAWALLSIAGVALLPWLMPEWFNYEQVAWLAVGLCVGWVLHPHLKGPLAAGIATATTKTSATCVPTM